MIEKTGRAFLKKLLAGWKCCVRKEKKKKLYFAARFKKPDARTVPFVFEKKGKDSLSERFIYCQLYGENITTLEILSPLLLGDNISFLIMEHRNIYVYIYLNFPSPFSLWNKIIRWIFKSLTYFPRSLIINYCISHKISIKIS